MAVFQICHSGNSVLIRIYEASFFSGITGCLIKWIQRLKALKLLCVRNSAGSTPSKCVCVCVLSSLPCQQFSKLFLCSINRLWDAGCQADLLVRPNYSWALLPSLPPSFIHSFIPYFKSLARVTAQLAAIFYFTPCVHSWEHERTSGCVQADCA